MCFGLIGSAETTFYNEGLDQKSQLEVVRANLENQSISANHLLFPTCVPGGVIPCIQWQLVLGHATNHKTTVQKMFVDVARSQRSLSNFPPQRRSLNKCSPPYLIWFKSTFHLGVNFTVRCAKSSEISVTFPPVFCLKFFDTKQPQTHLSENFFGAKKCPHAHIWCFCSCHVLKEPFHRDCVTFQWPLVKSKFPVKKFRLCYSGERTQEHAPGLISMSKERSVLLPLKDLQFDCTCCRERQQTRWQVVFLCLRTVNVLVVCIVLHDGPDRRCLDTCLEHRGLGPWRKAVQM